MMMEPRNIESPNQGVHDAESVIMEDHAPPEEGQSFQNESDELSEVSEEDDVDGDGDGDDDDDEYPSWDDDNDYYYGQYQTTMMMTMMKNGTIGKMLIFN